MSQREFLLEPADNARLAAVCGQFDEHLRQIERSLDVVISNRSNSFSVDGDATAVDTATAVITTLFERAADTELGPDEVHLVLATANADQAQGESVAVRGQTLRTRRGDIEARGANQRRYVDTIRSQDLCFGIGPAGTGKTFLAVACAVDALERGEVQRLVLVRPAVEAGERLGFLPGDLAAKVDPYLRPMYDALYEMLGYEYAAKLTERNVIEVAPLAFMRGRTLNDAFVILDEAQNTTVEQMKMFLTRIGFGSRAVVTGDITQTDLPRSRTSGLRHAMGLLAGVRGVGVAEFTSADVVRHPLVQRIVEAYDRASAIEDDAS